MASKRARASRATWRPCAFGPAKRSASASTERRRTLAASPGPDRNPASSSRSPSRNAHVQAISSGMRASPSRKSSITTAAGMRSTRLVSIPGSAARRAAPAARMRCLRRAISVALARAPCRRATSSPRAAQAIATSALTVPDVPMARRVPARRTRDSASPSSRRRCFSSWRTCPVLGGSSTRNRSVRRATPSGRLRIHTARPSRTSTSSTLPPPTSTRRWGPPSRPRAWRAARKMRRASSRPETMRTGMPVSRRSNRTKEAPFRASRTALVATAPRRSTCRARARRSKVLSVRRASSAASRSSFPLVKARWPRRTISFRRSTTWMRPSGLTSATSMCRELEPTSIAASRTAGMIPPCPCEVM